MTRFSAERWQLPDGVDELLPDAAWQVELLRRRIMDCCQNWGFDLVMPPMIEYLDSLLTGTGETMDLQTFKLVDQQNGRTLGVRADMTPQVARMDAHALRSDLPNRLFYLGSVLRARTDGFGGSRSPLQFGAELFGHSGSQSDIEIIRLMLASIAQAGIEPQDLTLDLGHVGVYRALIAGFKLNAEAENDLFSSVQRGSLPDVKSMLSGIPQAEEQIGQLMNLRGGESVLGDAREAFKQAPGPVIAALDSLQAVIDGVRLVYPEINVHLDLAEVRGYSYHTGVLFAAYTANGVELARGGRYDAVGAAFGHPRPATGFSGDLKNLADRGQLPARNSRGIFVSAELVDNAWSEILRLRQNGERVLTGLSGIDSASQSATCDRELVRENDSWVLTEKNSG